MNQSQNDNYAVTQKHLHQLQDSKLSIPPDSYYKKSCHPMAHPVLDRETRSFIVIWQLPGVEYHEINKSNS